MFIVLANIVFLWPRSTLRINLVSSFEEKKTEGGEDEMFEHYIEGTPEVQAIFTLHIISYSVIKAGKSWISL